MVDIGKTIMGLPRVYQGSIDQDLKSSFVEVYHNLLRMLLGIIVMAPGFVETDPPFSSLERLASCQVFAGADAGAKDWTRSKGENHCFINRHRTCDRALMILRSIALLIEIIYG